MVGDNCSQLSCDPLSLPGTLCILAHCVPLSPALIVQHLNLLQLKRSIRSHTSLEVLELQVAEHKVGGQLPPTQRRSTLGRSTPRRSALRRGTSIFAEQASLDRVGASTTNVQ